MADAGEGENMVRCHIEGILGAEPGGNYSYVMHAFARELVVLRHTLLADWGRSQSVVVNGAEEILQRE